MIWYSSLMFSLLALFVIFIIGHCVGGNPIFFDFDEPDDTIAGRVARATNNSEAKKLTKKLLNNDSVALTHLAKHAKNETINATSTVSPLELPPDENDEPPGPKPKPAKKKSKPETFIRRLIHTSGLEKYLTIILSPGLARSLTQLTPPSQQVFKISCIVKKSCTKEFVTGDSLSWILPGVSERARTRLWHQLLCSIRPGEKCPVDGGWGSWADWTECSATCGSVGQRVRRRLCDRPVAQNGGLSCRGRSAQIQYCVSKGCGLDELAGFMTERNPSQQLSLQIVQKQVHKHPEIESRCVREHCSYDHVRGIVGDENIQAFWASLHCLKQSVACPMVGGWSEWSDYSECSARPCGDGQELKFRSCTDPPASLPEARCKGKPYKAKDCSVPCPPSGESTMEGEWSPFGEWSECSAECGVGTQERHRTCQAISLRGQPKDGDQPSLDELTQSGLGMPFRKRRRVRVARAAIFGPPAFGPQPGNYARPRLPVIGRARQNVPRHRTWLVNGNVIDPLAIFRKVASEPKHAMRPPRPWRPPPTINIDDGYPPVPKPKPVIPQHTAVVLTKAKQSGKVPGVNGIDLNVWKPKKPVVVPTVKPPKIVKITKPDKHDSYTGPKRIDLRFHDDGDKKKKLKGTVIHIDDSTEPAENTDTTTENDWDATLCGGSSREVQVCTAQCSLAGGWSEWSGWSACSADCGPGVSTRDRICSDPPPEGDGALCEGPGSEVHYCFQRPCTVETRLLATFNASGYLIYRPLYTPTALLLLYIRFRPETPDAVLMHRFQNKCPESRNCDWTKLTLISGFLVLESTQHQCKVKLEAKLTLDMGNWHEVSVAIMGDRAFMRVDNSEEHRKAYLSCVPRGPNYDMDMYVGSDRNKRMSYRGTVSALAVNFMEYSVKTESDWTAGGVPSISESVSTSVATADDVYVKLDSDDFFTAQCPGNETGDKGERLDFVVTFMIKQHGVVMFTRGLEEATFIYLKTDDVFKLCAQHEASKECLASDQNAELNKWYRLRVTVKPKVITMVVNFVYRTQLMRGFKFGVCRKIMYVGGGPPDTLKKIDEPNGFQGMVESFLLNGLRDTSREMSVKEWGGMVSSAVACLADHYTEAVYQEGHSPSLSCDYSDVIHEKQKKKKSEDDEDEDDDFSQISEEEDSIDIGSKCKNDTGKAKTRWIRLDELIGSKSPSIESSPPYSVLRLDPHSKDVEGFYACLVSTPSRSWLLHAFGVSFIRTKVVVPESLAEEWVAIMSVAIGVLLLLMTVGLLYVSKNRRFGFFPGVMRMIYGERLSEAEQLDYLQLQTGEYVKLTPSRRRLLRPSKQSLIISRSKHSLATPSKTVTLSPSHDSDYFLEPSKQVRFAHELKVTRSPSGRAVTHTPSGAGVTTTGSGRVIAAGGRFLGQNATLSPSGRITGYDVDVTTTEVTSDDGSEEESDDSATPLMSGGSPSAVISTTASGSTSARRLSAAGSASSSARRLSTTAGSASSLRPSSQAMSDSASEEYPPMPGTADELTDDSEPFSP